MPRIQPPKGYYTSTEAQKILNISGAMLRIHAQKGKIRYLVLPGRKQGFYLKRDVDTLANELRAFFDLGETVPSTFSRATKEDIPQCVEVSSTTFGPTSIPVETRIAWFERNQNTFFTLKREQEVIGYLCLLPLKDIKKVEGLLHDTALNMTPEDIVEPGTKGPLHLYIMTMVIKAGYSHLEKRTYGARLVSGLIDTLIKMGEDDIVIKTLAARSETPDGIRLMRKMGFTELPPSGRQRKFIINVEESGIPAIMQYKQALQKYKANGDERAYIDKMAEAQELLALQYASDTSAFSVATEEDMQGIYDVMVSLWGTLNVTPVETRRSWQKINPEMDYVVKKEGIVVGYITIKPYKDGIMDKIIQGKMLAKDVQPTDILPFTPGIPIECLVGTAVRAGVYQPEKYGMRLIIGAVKVLKGLAGRGVIISKLYANSETPDGIKLCRDLGFQDITSQTNVTPRRFLLDFNESDAPLVQEYKKILQEHNV